MTAKIIEIVPNIRQFEYRQGRENPDYSLCSWAMFVLDCTNYTLYITSDCGRYSYSWAPTPESESFVHLVSRIDSDYLLRNIEFMRIFDYEKSLNNVIEYLKDAAVSEEELERLKERMDHESEIGLAGIIDDEFKAVCKEGLDNINRADLLDGLDDGGCVYEYPLDARKVIQVFCEYLQPLLKSEVTKKELRENASNT